MTERHTLFLPHRALAYLSVSALMFSALLCSLPPKQSLAQTPTQPPKGEPQQKDAKKDVKKEAAEELKAAAAKVAQAEDETEDAEEAEAAEGAEAAEAAGAEPTKDSREEALSPLGPIAQPAKAPRVKSKRSVKGKKKRRRFPTNRPKRELKAPPPLGKIPFPLGERLTYKVNLLNAHAGTVTLKVGQRGTYQGRKVVEFSGFIQSSPFLENFYPIRDSLSVLVDEVTFLPLKSSFFLNEQQREVKYVSEYDLEQHKVSWRQERKRKGKTRTSRYVHDAPKQLYESLSSLYALRRLELKPGVHFEQYVWDGKRERLVEAKVVGEERILTDLGWFETYKLEVSTVLTGGILTRRLLKQPPVKGVAWIAKDAHHTPVKLQTPSRLGEAIAVISQRTIDAPK